METGEQREIALLVNHPFLSRQLRAVERGLNSPSFERAAERKRKKRRVSINAWYRRTHNAILCISGSVTPKDEWVGVSGNESKPLQANYFNYSRVAG